MRDMMGIDLEEGQHIFYFCPGPGGYIHEEAEVILVRKSSIRVEFLGNVTRSQQDQLFYGRKKGDKTNLYNTTGKVFILCKHVEKERAALQDRIKELIDENYKLIKGMRQEEEMIKLYNEILDLQDKLKIINGEKVEMQEELEKIHYRSDILDL